MAVGLAGNDGLVGLGVKTSPMRAMVQVPGNAWRMKTAFFVWEFQKNAFLRQAVLGYVHTLTLQISQTARCNRFHSIEERLARWLLMTRVRLSSHHMRLTHEFLGYLLGVRVPEFRTPRKCSKSVG